MTLTASVFEQDMTRSENLPVLGGSVVLRYNAVSTFILDVNGNSDMWDAFIRDHDVEGYHVRIRDGDADIMSGVILGYEETSNGTEKTITLNGKSHVAYLDGMITIPDPARPVDDQTTVSHYKDSGPAGSIINTMVNRHRGQGAKDWNRTQLRTDTDLVYPGGHATINSRYQNLLSVAQAAAQTGNVRFDTAIRDGVIRFIVDQPTDRSAEIVLRQTNNALTSHTLSRKAPEATRALVAGQGEATNRMTELVEEETPNKWGIDILTYEDRRDTDDLNELVEAGQNALDQGKASASISLDATDVPGQQYGHDFIVGDTISVQLADSDDPDKGRIVNALQRAEITWSADGRDVQLHVGPYLEETDESREMKLVRRLLDELRRLQT